MLVPSTFTGWYKNMMIKAEIASEMIRSRTQTPSPLVIRGGAFDANSAIEPAVGAGATISAAELGSESVPDMFPYCIQNLLRRRRLYLIGRSDEQDLVLISCRLRPQVTIPIREDFP